MSIASFKPVVPTFLMPRLSRAARMGAIAGTRLIESARVSTAGILMSGVTYERSDTKPVSAMPETTSFEKPLAR